MSRILESDEKKKRGCVYCNDLIKEKGKMEERYYDITISKCPFEECPYHELDKYNTYNDYLKSEDSKLKFNFENLLL